MRKFIEALSYYEIAITLNPNYAEAYCNSGVLKTTLKDSEGAIKDFNKALKIDPDFAIVYNNRALAEKELKMFNAALEDFKKAISIDNLMADFYNNRGLVNNTRRPSCFLGTSVAPLVALELRGWLGT